MPAVDAARADVLIVDDLAENLQILTEVLHEEGYHVRPVTNGEMALLAARERTPDIILLDISMPEMSGFEVCQALKADHNLADIPVLFITALQQTENKLLAFQVGGADYITKPFHFEEVKARVRTHLELHRKSRELRDAYERLVRVEKMRDSLTHMIVHDLRAPLSGVVGSLRLMQEDARTEGGLVDVEDLSRAELSCNRLVRLINDLLDIARMEAAELPLTLDDVDVRAIVSGAVRMLGPSAQPLVVVHGPDAVMVRADGAVLERVVVNLLDNAFKHSRSKSPVDVTVSVDDDSVTILVEDRGPGIPDDFKTKVFEKFGQVEVRRAKVPSTGLGLAFCRLAVEAHGGSIRAKDREGGGTSIEIRFPRTETRRS